MKSKGEVMFNELRLLLDRIKTKREALFEADHPATGGKLLSFYTCVMTKVTDS